MQRRFKKVVETDYEPWNIFTDGLTQSSIATFQQCPMKLDYKLKQRLTSGEYNAALDFGTLFHEVLDIVYTQKIKAPKAPWQTLCDIALTREYKKVLEQYLDPADMQKFEVLHGMAGIVLPIYFKRWAEADTKYKWLDVEKEFTFFYDLSAVLSPIPIRGKIDGIVEDSDGNLWLFEHKTKSDIDNMGKVSCQALVEKMGYELQVMVYALAMRSIYGKYPKGVVYNLIKRPGQKYTGMFNRKPETIPMYLDRVAKDMAAKGDAYFCRYNITLSPEEIEHFQNVELNYWLNIIYGWSLRTLESPRVSGSCIQFRRPCEFLSICSEGDKSRFKNKVHLFPELVMVDD